MTTSGNSVETTDKMLVFRTGTTQPEPPLPERYEFAIFETVRQGLRLFPAFARSHGVAAATKMIAKLGTARRSYYAVLTGDGIASEGWLTKGRCAYYPVGPEDIVIGPIETDPQERGRGLAHASLTRAINRCLADGAPFVWIDTTADNHASRRAIEKSGMQPT